MVVIVDESSGESTTAVLEDQLQVRALRGRVVPGDLRPNYMLPLLYIPSHCLFRRVEEPPLGRTPQLGATACGLQDHLGIIPLHQSLG